MHKSIRLPWERSRRGLFRDECPWAFEVVICVGEVSWARARLEE